jgi:hypothetical protein
MRPRVLLLFLGLVAGVSALYDGSDVVQLHPGNFKGKLEKQPALVEFYAPW